MQNYNERGPKKRKKEGKKSAMFLDTGKKQWESESLCTEIQEQTMSMHALFVGIVGRRGRLRFRCKFFKWPAGSACYRPV